MFEIILVYGILILIFGMLMYMTVDTLRFDKRINERLGMRKPTIKNKKSEFPDLENEIENLRLEYDRAKKFKKLTSEKEILEKAINEIYEEKTKPLDTSDFIKEIEENRKKLYFNIPTKEELQEGNMKVYYKKKIDDFIKTHEFPPGYHYLSLLVNEHDTSGDIVREVIRSYDCAKEYSFYATSYLNGSQGVQVERYCTLELNLSGGSECESQRSIT